MNGKRNGKCWLYLICLLPPAALWTVILQVSLPGALSWRTPEPFREPDPARLGASALPDEPLEFPGLTSLSGSAPLDPVGETTVFRGTVRVVGGTGPVERPTGTISFMLIGKPVHPHRIVEVTGGEWSLQMERDRAIRLGAALLEGRPARLDSTRTIWLPTGELIQLTARWPGETVLHVVDGATGEELTSVEVIGVLGDGFRGEFHPGSIDPLEVLAARTSSPIDLNALRRGRSEHTARPNAQRVFVRAPGYAWMGAQAQFGVAHEQTVELPRAGRLEVTLDNRAKGFPCRFRLRSDGLGTAQPVVDLAVRDERIEVDSLRPGIYVAEVALGSPSVQTVLGSAPVEVFAGEFTELALQLDDIAPGTPVPLAGRVLVPEHWETRRAELRLHPETGERRGELLRTLALRRSNEEPEGGYRTLLFSAPALPPGAYTVQLMPSGHVDRLWIPAVGDTNVVLALPLEARVRPLNLGPFLIEGAGDSLVAAGRTSGCFSGYSVATWFEPRGDRFVSEHGSVASSHVAELRSRLLASRESPNPVARILEQPSEFLATLGVTAEAFDCALEAALGPYLARRWGVRDGLPPKVRQLAQFERVRAALAEYALNQGPGSTTTSRIEFWLPGEPVIRVTSSGDSPLKLPWTVIVGDAAWECVDPAVPAALAPLAPQRGAGVHDLAGAEYWKKDIWRSDWIRPAGGPASDRRVEHRVPPRPADAVPRVAATARAGSVPLDPLAPRPDGDLARPAGTLWARGRGDARAPLDRRMVASRRRSGPQPVAQGSAGPAQPVPGLEASGTRGPTRVPAPALSARPGRRARLHSPRDAGPLGLRRRLPDRRVQHRRRPAGPGRHPGRRPRGGCVRARDRGPCREALPAGTLTGALAKRSTPKIERPCRRGMPQSSGP
jgi:hypothetical protein